jgi:uncharacterized protein
LDFGGIFLGLASSIFVSLKYQPRCFANPIIANIRFLCPEHTHHSMEETFEPAQPHSHDPQNDASLARSEDHISTSKKTAAPQVQSRLILLGMVLLCMLGGAIGAFMYMLLALAFGWPLTGPDIKADMPMNEAWIMRFQAFLSQLFTFLLPALGTIYLFRMEGTVSGIQTSLARIPSLRMLLLGALLWLTSLPLTAWVYQINSMVPLPDTAQKLYELAEQATKALLQMPTVWDLLANLILIAVIPAIGEELLFRGILQGQLQRRMAPWAAIVVASAIFSFIHFQFDGFLPRMLLGLVLGWAYWRTGRIWVPIVMHFLNNGLIIMAQYIYGSNSSMIEIEPTWWAALGSLILLVWVGELLPKADDTPTSPA